MRRDIPGILSVAPVAVVILAYGKVVCAALHTHRQGHTTGAPIAEGGFEGNACGPGCIAFTLLVRLLGHVVLRHAVEPHGPRHTPNTRAAALGCGVVCIAFQ